MRRALPFRPVALLGALAVLAALEMYAVSTVAHAEDGPAFYLGLATSYVYDFNRPDNGGMGSFNSKSYAGGKQADAFNIDLLQLGIIGTRGRASYGAKIDLGDRARSLNDSGTNNIAVQEAWIRYDMDVLSLRAGRYGTPIGYEVREPWGNPNVSRSYGWDIQPANHDGFTLSGGAGAFEVMMGLANGFTANERPPVGGPVDPGNDIDDEKAVLGKVGFSGSDRLGLMVAGIYSELLDTEKRTMITAIVDGAVAAAGVDLRYALEAQWRQDRDSVAGLQAGQPGQDLQNWGVVGYLVTGLGCADLAVRLEWVDDGGILTGGFNNSFAKDVRLWEITTTFSWPLVAGVDLRLEYRHDQANDPIYAADSGRARYSDDVIQAQLVWHPSL
ncbi:MAG: outer membrane beta-barrel protein [Candidatus Binatia bacterium]